MDLELTKEELEIIVRALSGEINDYETYRNHYEKEKALLEKLKKKV